MFCEFYGTIMINPVLMLPSRGGVIDPLEKVSVLIMLHVPD